MITFKQRRTKIKALISFRHLQKKVNRPPEAKIANRSIKKHQRRLSSGAATRIPYPGLSDALVGATASFVEAAVNNSKLSDLSELMTMKCDVCVLSEYNQVFRLLDGILETDMVIHKPKTK